MSWIDDLRAAKADIDKQLAESLVRYTPPHLRPVVGLIAEANPVVSVERAGTAARGLASSNATPMQRIGYAGDMLSNMAGVAAPAMVAGRAGVPAANAIQEGLTGLAATARFPEFIADESGALRLYHGSPHDFDKFSMDKIGTGEGAQAYGHGLYFAEAEDTAKAYRDALSPGIDGTGLSVRIDGIPIKEPTTDQIRAARFGPDQTAAGIQRQIEAAKRKLATASDVDELGIGVSDRDMIQMDIDSLKRRLDEVQGLAGRVEMGPAGRMYEVEVNANPEDFLDWDAPLSAQPGVLSRLGFSQMDEAAIHAEAQKIMEAQPGGAWMNDPVSKARIDELQDMLDRRAPNMTGQEYYRGGNEGDVSNLLSQMGYGNPEAQTAALREAGIPGIRYLDQGSRGAGDGSRNYVVFDENLISIVRKYGIAGAAAMLGMSEADVAQAMGQPSGNDLDSINDWMMGR